MAITVKIPAQLRAVTGGEGEIEVEGTTVGEALDAVFEQHQDLRERIDVECIDTGLDTPTGGRVAIAADRFSGGTFCLTYADGVADIDLGSLLAFHHRQRALATMTVVRPYSQWGIAVIDDDERISGFHEKPRLDYWVNGGFFCLEPEFLDYVAEDSVLERDPLERVAAEGRLGAFRHHGFWDCMDTYKDAIVLNDLWESGEAPWRLWREGSASAVGSRTNPGG